MTIRKLDEGIIAIVFLFYGATVSRLAASIGSGLPRKDVSVIQAVAAEDLENLQLSEFLLATRKTD